MNTKEKREVLEVLRELVFVPGISGYEHAVAAWIAERIPRGLKPTTDNLGNMYVTIGSGKPHLLFVAHMDEIGVVISHIEDDGYARIRKIGGLDDRALLGRLIDFRTARGTVTGVIGIKPPHLMVDREKEMKESLSSQEMFVDFGTKSRRETERLGIHALTPGVLKKQFAVLNNQYVSCRGLDDRVGCAALVYALQAWHRKKSRCTITVAWSVQEEIGLRGAMALAHSLEVDHAFPIDSCATADAPAVTFHLAPTRLGKGPVLRLIDRVAIASPSLLKKVEQVAKRLRIPLQLAVAGGTTDGSALQTTGIDMVPLCVAARYVHAPCEMIHLGDFYRLVDLIVGLPRLLK
jgi:putative aminopeptidase FrvX